MRVFGFVVFVFLFTMGHSQAPQIERWDKRFGGSLADGVINIIQIKQGGYILFGEATSDISGNKTEPNWDTTLSTADYWIVKIDAHGNQEWDKRFGGTSVELSGMARQTKDGGYILGGISGSGIGGDKTQEGWGSYDYWIVKIDSAGNKQWDKDYGGPGEDDLYDLQQTRDGGYILGGFSWSGAGGSKTQSNWDHSEQTVDFWIVKIDSVGNKKWDKRYGGNADDYFARIIQTMDGGYLLGGSTESDSGDNVSMPARGKEDAWFIKIDSIGNKQWDLRLGGTANTYSGGYPTIQTSDSGYILACGSTSNIGGDKTENTYGDADYWIVKIDANGHKLWDKDFGGAQGDALTYLTKTLDGGYLMSGESHSPAGADKTENNLGSQQIWMLKTDSLWRKEWDKTIFTTGGNDVGYAIQSDDNCYVAMVSTWAGTGGYKTQPNWDSTNLSGDFWVAKFCFNGYPEEINEVNNNIRISVYPNPFCNEVDISIAKQDLHAASFSIYNVQGQAIYKREEDNLSPNYTKMLDLSYLPNGIYFVEVVVDGERVVREVVKE